MESNTASPSFGSPPRYPLESVDNALRVLALFGAHDRVRGKDVADVLGVASGTARRLLAALQYRGFVAQDALTRVYVPGPMLLTLGVQALQGSELRTVARPFLEELRERLDETIQLATLLGREVLFVDGFESSKALRVASRAGTLRPAHCTSVGKVLLASLSDDQVRTLLPEEELEQPTPKSIGSRSELLIELAATRARGYAVNFGELEAGVGSVARAIRSGDRTVAAIGTGAPLSRLDDEKIALMADALADVAGRLGAKLSA